MRVINDLNHLKFLPSLKTPFSAILHFPFSAFITLFVIKNPAHRSVTCYEKSNQKKIWRTAVCSIR